ncbi:MAG: S8 family serine peptidase [Pseudomonadota bacterium]
MPVLGAIAGGGAVAGGAAGGAAVLGTATAGTAAVTGAAAAATVTTVAATGATVAGGTVAVGAASAAGVGATAGSIGSGVLTEVAIAGSSVQAGTALGAGLVNTQLISELQAGIAAAPTGSAALGSKALALRITAGTQFVPNEILVTNLSAPALAWARARGFRFTEAGTLNNLALTLVRMQPPAGLSVQQALAGLQQADPSGQYEQNPVYRLADGSSQCEGLRCYAQTLVRWPAACGAAVRVGMLDGAVDAQHPALKGRAVETRRFAPGTPSPIEREHGTAIAALLAGGRDTLFPGLLPQSQLFAADVFSPDAKGQPYTDAARLAAALDWLAGHQPSVINISLAGPDSRLLASAIRRVVQSGTGVVAAVGNLGPEAPKQYPAAYPEVVGVTAVDRQLHVYQRANQGSQVALAAPGVGIWTAGLNAAGRYRDGTSFAAPFVTAAYSVLSARRPDLAPLGVAAQLRQAAKPLGDASAAAIYGAGLLQAPECRE